MQDYKDSSKLCVFVCVCVFYVCCVYVCGSERVRMWLPQHHVDEVSIHRHNEAAWGGEGNDEQDRVGGFRKENTGKFRSGCNDLLKLYHFRSGPAPVEWVIRFLT